MRFLRIRSTFRFHADQRNNSKLHPSRFGNAGGNVLKLVLVLATIVLSLVILEAPRRGVDVAPIQIGQTPVVRYATANADGPVVVVAHGFAGSQQMMQGYALPLARAGYRVYAFDFLGHGRHPVPMSGDVTSVDGTTRLLMEQTAEVLDAVGTGPGPIALLGHSMATDILVRVAAIRDDIGPLVLVSAFSGEIDANTPDDLLLVTGAWEPGLRRFARESVQLVDPEAEEGNFAGRGDVLRRAVVAPFSEHVSVLHSRVARREAVAWLDRSFGRTSDIAIWPTGWAILGLLAGLVLVFRPLTELVPRRDTSDRTLGPGQTTLVLLLPVVVAPVFATRINIDVLPVLVADYLVLHMLVFGALQLALLRFFRIPAGHGSIAGTTLLLTACAAFGFALDRYAANFWPTSARFWIIAAMLVGTLPYMIADAILTANQSIAKRLCSRASFLASLGIAVAIDFNDLFFLLLIAPVLVLFYIVFGTMGRAISERVGPLSAGLALGIVLAWSLGVSFPVFQA